MHTKSARRDFIRLPSRIYRNDPAFIPRLEMEMRELISPKNPFFLHAQHQLFVAYENGEPVGRISAQIDALAQHDDTPMTACKIGHFGFIDAARAELVAPLLAAAENWLRSHGVTRVMGPFSFSINQESGLLVEGFDTPPFLLMNHAPAWLAGAVNAAGYDKVKDLIAFRMDATGPFPPSAQRLAQQAQSVAGLTLRPLDKKKFFEDVSSVLTIYNEAWRDNWGFVALTAEEIHCSAKNLKPLVIPELVYIAEINGEPAAMILALPNAMEAMRDLRGKLLPFGWLKLLTRLKISGLHSARVMCMGIRPQFRTGFMSATLSALLIYQLRQACVARQIHDIEMSWILEDNMPMIRLIEAVGGKAYKRYRLYTRDIA
ncbi:MAG: hypothetical protein K2Q12_10620 [Rickettsiales bacterium]|nr:hypothetical protein [Rickettsiales bacterium]